MLEQEAPLLRDVVDALTEGVVVWRPEGGQLRLVLVNRAVRALYRGDPADLPGRSAEEVFGMPARSEIVETMHRALRTGQPHQSLVEVADGLWPAGIHEASHVPMPGGLLLSAFRDVSERVRGERLLARAYEETAEVRATLQTALDSLHEAFALFEVTAAGDGDAPALAVVHANQAAARGGDPDALVGVGLHDLIPAAAGSGLWRVVVASLEDWAPRTHRSFVEGPSGELTEAWDTTVSRVSEDRVVLTWRDATREETALRALASSRDEAVLAATHDHLTGLPNRALSRRKLAEALTACREGERVAVVFVDLDGFKAVNDVHGHAAGDDVLRATAHRLSRAVRQHDTAARLSGDEFLLVLRELRPEWDTASFTRRVTAALAAPVWVEGAVVEPSASLGVVLVGPGHGAVDVDALVARSDALMYEAKASRVPVPR